MTAAAASWRRRAVCVRETPDAPELWTPDRRPAPVVRVYLEQMCQRCPVRRTCAGLAVDSAAETGIYAGVWVPQQADRKKWPAAMRQLERIAAGKPETVGTEAPEVPL